MTQQPKWGSLIGAVALLVIGLATLIPTSAVSGHGTVNACPRFCGDALLVDFILNGVLFLPLGFGLRLAGIRGRWVIMIGVCLTVAIELLQLRVIAGRDASVLDVIANSLGAAAGVWLAETWPALVRPGPQMARRLLLAAGSLWLLTAFVGGLAVLPAPTDAAYYGQLAPVLRQYSPFDGQLLAAKVNGVQLPSGYLVDGDRIREGLRQGRIHLDALVRPGPAPPSLAPIVRLADFERHEILLLGQHGRDLAFKLRLHASELGMKTPSVVMAKVFPVDGTTMVAIRAEVTHERVRLSVMIDSVPRITELPLSPSLLWAFFVPWQYGLGPNARLLTAVWIAGLLVPVGYWGFKSRSNGAGGSLFIAVVAVIALSIVVVPATYGLPPAPWLDWLAAAIGVVSGSLIASRIGRTTDRKIGATPADDARGVLVG